MPKMSAGETLESALPRHCLEERSLGYTQTFCASSGVYSDKVALLSLGKTTLYALKEELYCDVQTMIARVNHSVFSNC